MSATVAGAPWLTAPHVVRVLDALEAEGGPGCARFVGGCVRNALLGAPVDDIDLATPLVPERTVEALERAGLRAVPTGVQHGTMTAVADGEPVEVTTLRRDVETDGRRAVVAFTTDWAEDAARRDFRLNALYADREGRVHQPVPGGVEDALAGRIIFVGNPETRIREDYLRILRFFRFRAWYGRGAADADAVAACAELKDGLRGISRERLGGEFLKLLAAPDPTDAVRLMDGAGVLSVVVPRAALGAPLQHGPFERMARLSPDPVLRLAALLPAEAPALEETAAALRLSNAHRLRLLDARQGGPGVSPGMTPREARAAIARLGASSFSDQLLLACAEMGDGEPDALLELARDWRPPLMPVTGTDLKAAGLPPGPALGQALRRLEQAWVDSDFTLGREALLARLDAQPGS